jgi:hypothetical protein
MKNYSLWAKSHPIQARWLIAGAHLFLFLLAFFAGFQLWLNDFEHSPMAQDVFTTIFLLGVVFYPIRGATHWLWKHSYKRQKTFDFVVVFTGFLSLTAMTSIKLEQASQSTSTAYAVKTASLIPGEHPSRRASFKEQISLRTLIKNAKMLKKELKQARKMAKTEQDEVGLKVLFTFLVLVGAIGLSILILLWACDLSCSGQEGAANVVLIGGGALVILLAVLGIRAIWKKKK